MKAPHRILIAIALLASLALTSAQQQWEYSMFTFNSGVRQVILPDATYKAFSFRDLTAELPDFAAQNSEEPTMNDLLQWYGTNGWELTAIEERGYRYSYIFKRPAP